MLAPACLFGIIDPVLGAAVITGVVVTPGHVYSVEVLILVSICMLGRAN